MRHTSGARTGSLLSLIAIFTGFTAEAQNHFEVASIKSSGNGSHGYAQYSPATMILNHVTIKSLLEMALPQYLQEFQIIGAPNWFYSEYYDIVAKTDPPVSEHNPVKPTDKEAAAKERRERIWSLLQDRWQLKIHHETRQHTVYAFGTAGNQSIHQ